MKITNTKRIYISDADPSCYESVKGFIDSHLAEKCVDNKIILVCRQGGSNNVLAKRYAIEKGLKVEFLPALINKRKLVKLCDLLLLFRSEENSEINELMSYALNKKTSFFVEDIA